MNNQPGKIATALAICGIVFVVWFVWFYGQSSAKWDGDGQISLFPNGAESKNYRLPATLTVSKRATSPLTFKEVYVISSFTWPEAESETGFRGECEIEQGSSSNCTTKDGREYRVEVNTPPDQPESDSNDE